MGFVSDLANTASGGALSGASGLISTAFGKLGSLIFGDDDKKAYKRQLEMLGLQQNFSREMLANQQKFAKQMYDYNNRYNTPAAIVARLKEAGLNPALMYGGAGTSMQASQPPSPSAFGASVPSSPVTSAEVELMRAQADALRSDSQLKKSQTAGTDLDNLYKEFTMQDRVNLAGVTVSSAYAGLSLTREQKRVAMHTIEQLKASVEQYRSTIDNIDADTYSKVQQILITDQAFDSLVQSIVSKADFDKVQADNLEQLLKSQIFANVQNGYHLKSQTDLNNLDLGIFSKPYGTYDSFRQATILMSSQQNIVSAIMHGVQEIIDQLRKGNPVVRFLDWTQKVADGIKKQLSD